MTTQDGKKRVIVTLDADLLNQFDALCRERGQCRANAIEAMMRRYLARQVRSERKEREICWDPDRMILHALAVQKDVRALSSALDRHEDLLMGQGHVRPVLLALATEIALKAWQCRERKGPPDHGHDLVELFDALSEDARERLQAQLPEWPWPLGARWSDLARDPFGGGMRKVLEFHRNTFKTWRYSYEKTALVTWLPQLDAALTAIIETYNPPALLRLPGLGNRARSRKDEP